MGIKGIYRELGTGQRVALSKLAADYFHKEKRPLRLAIDIAIWQFQTQAAQGGTNPAIRTLFYRLARLLATPVEPIFVFDGPNKPAFKRNKRSGRGDRVSNAQAKRLIRLFGFTAHDAPGEAEAECALLQQHGIVDGVLSEDVDTIMFGCTRTLRNWSAEGKGPKTPTHISMYDLDTMDIGALGLGREGMVLVALMSGGDYLPEGIPGCGVKVACEAARAGFGKSICRLKASDAAGIKEWRESLIHELRTNEKGFFRTRHKALTIPEDFPNLEILRYYTHPVVSDKATVDAVRERFAEKKDMHLADLREFTRETFGWDYRIGALKFIRVLAPSLLVRKLHARDGESYVTRISSRRTHFSTDATPEFRLAYIPQDIVPIDLSQEAEEEISQSRDGLALNSDDEFEAPASSLEAPVSAQAAALKAWDPATPDLAWVLDAVAREAIPNLVHHWESIEAAKKTKKPSKKAAKSKTAGMQMGSMDAFVRITKPVASSKSQPIPQDKPLAKPRETPVSPKRRLLKAPAPLSPPEPSKQPSSSFTLSSSPPVSVSASVFVSESPVRRRDSWRLERSQPPPRTQTRTPESADRRQQQAIVIDSSPVAGSPAVPSPPKAGIPKDRSGADGMQQSVRAILAAGAPPKGMSHKGAGIKAASIFNGSSTFSQSLKLKQTSMDMFARKTEPGTRQDSGSQPSIAQQPNNQAAQQEEDSHDELEPLETLLSGSPSPSKRRREPLHDRPPSNIPTARPVASKPVDLDDPFTDPVTSRHLSPEPVPARKKKLLVPRTDAAGYGLVAEIEVDASERDDRIAREEAALRCGSGAGGGRGVAARVTRWSDVAFVDLTGDD